MKLSSLAPVAAAALLCAACANPERSRDVANPAVSAVTLAQQVCANCHGLKGSSESPNFPNLAGQTEAYVVAQLKGFRSHGRRDPAGFEYMWGLSRSLSDEQIKGLAAYYAGQKLRAPPSDSAPASVEAGRALFASGVPAKGIPACSACHGQEGKGQDAFPRIAGQHADYLMKQLLVFQRTDERPEGSIMKTVAHEMTPDNIRDVAAYLQALPGS
jgi:cytochrome c553